MPTPMSKFEHLDDAQLQDMINLTASKFPYLEYSSKDTLLALARLMTSNEFMVEVKPTPIRSSFVFLRKIASVIASMTQTEPIPVIERDFIFAIKMFGLGVRMKGGKHEFVADGVVDLKVDEETVINSSADVKRLEFYVSDINTFTKIQTNAIESALNRLQRDWREMMLARELGRLIDEGATIGVARSKIMQEWEVKEHEFVRIRQIALDKGWFVSKRRQSETSSRITLDEDVAPYIQQLRKTLADGRKRLTTSQAVNEALRRLSEGLFVKEGVNVPPFQPDEEQNEE
jgi:hypothetical protein